MSDVETYTAQLDGDTFTIVLPFPSRQDSHALSPNGRVHWSKKSRAAKAMRSTAQMVTRSALVHRNPQWERAEITYRFFWPDRRNRDFDNFKTVMKPAVDGIVDAGLIADDNAKNLRGSGNDFAEYDKANPRVEIVIERLNTEGRVA